VDWRLAVAVPDKWVGVSEFEKGLDNKGVPSEDGLIESEFAATVNLGPPLFKDDVEDVEVFVARGVKKIN